MADVVCGRYNDVLSDVTVVDCRYPYEFEGGHIKSAVNLFTKDDVNKLLQQSVNGDKRHVLIFHCEFSSERGPNMYRFLRSQDRELHKDQYPALLFPEVYLLHGGYKAFYNKFKVVSMVAVSLTCTFRITYTCKCLNLFRRIHF
ncbi:hypothetical protein DPMN_074234 [Dreissena polymorpha]|uniref:protein-tyrosine-phosphatase n=1 Tax=Dreissena polymorpha TaxID=45954 RepID=A0A9D3YI82_DREPO|nr:hypothetical protein DPMN_074234 [Dreissena polymorpha]